MALVLVVMCVAAAAPVPAHAQPRLGTRGDYPTGLGQGLRHA
jgi:hypothetical protein